MQIYYSTLLFAISLIFKLFLTKIERLYWMIRFHPQNPVTNLIMKWKYYRLALELHRELTNQQVSANLESDTKDK